MRSVRPRFVLLASWRPVIRRAAETLNPLLLHQSRRHLDAPAEDRRGATRRGSIATPAVRSIPRPPSCISSAATTHGDEWNNEVWSYDPVIMTWTQSYPEDAPAAYRYLEGRKTTTSGHPWAMHSFAMNAWAAAEWPAGDGRLADALRPGEPSARQDPARRPGELVAVRPRRPRVDAGPTGPRSRPRTYLLRTFARPRNRILRRQCAGHVLRSREANLSAVQRVPWQFSRRVHAPERATTAGGSGSS